jgi:GDP-4-dehydro-6-deoxy-D-mannose reductase
VVVTSSSAVYGRVSPDALPISEDHPFAPTNFYAVSKVAQEMIAYQYFAQYKLRVIRTRAFNLTGPGESSRFVTSAFARQIAEIEAGLREPAICVGNLDAVRDFTDVRDAVRAYKVLAEQGVSGEAYNVCSGQGTSIRDILNTLLDLSTQRNINVQIDPSRLQPADVPIQIGDASKLRALTGWTPVVPLRQTLEDVLNYWRKQVKEAST